MDKQEQTIRIPDYQMSSFDLNMKFFSIVKPQHSNRIYHRFYQRLAQSRRISLNALNRDLVSVAEDVVFHKNNLNPIVALESALYTHILPFPENFQLALHLQDLIRSTGAIPATIGVINSVAKIGLSDHEIHSLCSVAGKPETLKVSRNDLSFILGMGIVGSPSYGGTTISSTMTLARWAGINVLATSGLGDVHLGGKDPLSITADLTELGRTPIAIVSSGCKSFLDTHRTLEFLKTKGILVATYSDARVTNVNFPEYYSHDSGISSPRVFHNPKEAAAMIFSLAKLGTRGNRFSRSGVLFANPIPEEVSIPKEEIEKATHQALNEVNELGIHGQETAYFVLNKIKDFTNGRSDTVSRASIESNVILASKIAIEVASFWKLVISFTLEIQKQKSRIAIEKLEKLKENQACTNSIRPRITKYVGRSNSYYEARVNAFKTIKILGLNKTPEYSPNIAIIGAVANEQICDFILSPNAAFDTNLQPILKSTNHSRIEHTIGGVGHDIALATHLVSWNQRVRLCSLVANDLPGSTIVKSLKAETLDISGIKVLPETVHRSGQAIQNRTAQCVLINDGKKDLVLGMNDFQIFRHNSYECSSITTNELKWAIIDANWNRKTVRGLMSILRAKCPWTKIAFVPASEQKAADIFRTSSNPESESEVPNALDVYPNHKLDLATVSTGELNEMFCAANSHGYFENNDHWHVLDAFGIMGTQSNDRYKAIVGQELTSQGVPFQTVQLLPYIPMLLIKLGSKGVLLIELMKVGDPRLKDHAHEKWIVSRTRNGHMYIGGVYMRRFPAVETVDPADIVSGRGAGNTLIGILIAGLSRGLVLDENLINIAQRGAIMTLKCKQAVSPSLGELTQSLNRLALKPENLENGASSDTFFPQGCKEIPKNDKNNKIFDAPIQYIRNLTFEMLKYKNTNK
ncbi:hypothetical protein EPUL_004025, partial [Erysiphe pulchra]